MTESPTYARRTFIGGTLGLCFIPSRAIGQNVELVEGPIPPLPNDLAAFRDDPAYRPTTVTSPVGASAARPEEIEIGRQILSQAPIATSAFAVAQYFHELGQRNDGRAAYSREWPIRANPVIQTFFAATRTVPRGDTTPWCAAFINWCIARGRSNSAAAGISQNQRFESAALAATTRSAASGSFRCWTETTTPQVGDLVVFREPGSTQRCSGKGHVAFYAGEADRGYIRILGGNQLLRGTSGAVTISRYPRDGGEGGRLRFLGFRTAAGLR